MTKSLGIYAFLKANLELDSDVLRDMDRLTTVFELESQIEIEEF